ncbi:MAG: hypothetical protein IPN33_25435 [Saprospiraceae bacterium]|nr:hypothetical protein [Saprospiraceae bacterium]
MDSELRTIFSAIEKFYELEETRQQQEWERTRWQATTLVNIQLKRGDRMKVTQLLPLPWDNQEKLQVSKPLTYEEQKERFEKIDAFMKQRKGTS